MRKRQIRNEQELPVVPPGYFVAFAHKLRCLHCVGRCWRKQGRDIKNWQYYGQEQPGEQEKDHCKHCSHSQAKTLSRCSLQKIQDLPQQVRE